MVISDTSVLYYLNRLRKLELLRQIYGRIVVPDAVVEELEAGRKQGEEVPDLAQHTWIEIRSIHQRAIAALATDLGPGEAEVLALAIEHSGSLVILDDGLARETARMRGLRVTGTLGVILKARELGICSEVAPVLDELLRLGFRMSDDLRLSLLKAAGEAP